MKQINVLSWGGGTQSTALMLMILEKEINIDLDYIIFSDTGAEAIFTYEQIYKVQKYVKEKYNHDIIITSKCKQKKSDEDIIKMIKNNKIDSSYRTSKYSDLKQELKLYLKGVTSNWNAIPLWTIDNNGKLGKTPNKHCTIAYKVNQQLKELRLRENIKQFRENKHLINFHIGFSVDEISRVKPNPMKYAKNIFPLIDNNLTKEDCINYVNRKLGFKPVSSVCNICFANDIERVHKIYKEDKKGWQEILEIDNLMEQHKCKGLDSRLFLYNFQAKFDIRLKDLDIEKIYFDYIKNKNNQLSIYDMEEMFGCNEGCFL